MVALPGTMAPPAGVWSVTVSLLPTVLQAKPRSESFSLASAAVRPTQLGTLWSMAARSSSLYSGSTPRWGRISPMIWLAVGAAMLPPET